MSELSLLSGKITNLKTHKGYKSFMGSGAAKTSGVAAVGALASGAFFNSAFLTTAAMIQEDVTYFNCKVNDIRVMGYFNKVAFKNTDEVEFVVEYDQDDPDQAYAYAVRKPKERKLWVMDRMTSGENVVKEMCWRLPMITIGVFIPIPYIIALIMNGFENVIFITFAVLIGGGGLAYLTAWLGLRISFLPKAKIANNIIAALGYEDPKEISLAYESEKAKKRWEEEHGKPFPESDDLFVLHY
ncbi:MAG: putative type VI secretion system effector [Cellvibrionaceae bacterium]